MQSIQLLTRMTLLTKCQRMLFWIYTNWIAVFCCFLLCYLLAQKNITLQITLHNPSITTNTPVLSMAATTLQASVPMSPKPLTAQQQKQLAYVQRFAKVAQREMHLYGIPASIKLAQGLLESQAGTSSLATKNNNHFGIKCFSKSCQKGHCRNFSDDSHKDFFRIYPTAWDSYRAHSLFLQGSRYQHLKSAEGYRAWAHGLQRAGYATDTNYAKKLIRLIEELGLGKYDIG